AAAYTKASGMQIGFARARLTALFAVTLLGGCATEVPPKQEQPAVAERTITARTVRAACGSCLFDMPRKGCFWAVEIDGVYYAAKGGALPKGHSSHAPDGMCNVERQATVEGTIVGDELVATRFDLLPMKSQ